ncbi:hypothetical protein [Thiohalophilus sp.]|uniref:hypothetical protein n=1 Tax=Thiohalophilus sp. TaxID=3028392 RepID=UPI002ACE2CAD|nr:hypothetical protein [Thiohalophilus sp.]MDZ7803841.1 hypothetical protein [Thiohalophilus sp.]
MNFGFDTPDFLFYNDREENFFNFFALAKKNFAGEGGIKQVFGFLLRWIGVSRH